MANYAVLKAAINAVIKTNGNKEITGQVLNQTLMAIVDSLGENYQFAGVAVPSTNPGTPDQNIFYLATQAGTYTNFGATVLPAGISMLEWKNNTWSSETFFTIDDAPTEGSDHLVKSGGVKTAIDNVAFSTNEKVKDVGIDSTPTSGSDNLIKSGAVFDAFKNDGGAYDVSVHFPTGGVEGGNTYTLDGAIAMVPQNMQKGGMSIKFVSSSDNKYVQYRLMHPLDNPSTAAADFANTDNWQGVDSEPTVGSDNLVKSGAVIPFISNDNGTSVSTFPQVTKVQLKANKTYTLFFKTKTLVPGTNTDIGIYNGNTIILACTNAEAYAGKYGNYTPSEDCTLSARARAADIEWEIKAYTSFDDFCDSIVKLKSEVSEIPSAIDDATESIIYKDSNTAISAKPQKTNIKLKANITYKLYFKTTTLVPGTHTDMGIYANNVNILPCTNAEAYAGKYGTYTPSTDSILSARTRAADVEWEIKVLGNIEKFSNSEVELDNEFSKNISKLQTDVDNLQNDEIKLESNSITLIGNGVMQQRLKILTIDSIDLSKRSDIFVSCGNIITDKGSNTVIQMQVINLSSSIILRKEIGSEETLKTSLLPYSGQISKIEFYFYPNGAGTSTVDYEYELQDVKVAFLCRISDIEVDVDNLKEFQVSAEDDLSALKSSIQWKDKNVVVYGDSITAQGNGDTPTNFSFMYWAYLLHKFAHLYVRGVGGQTFTWNNGGWYTGVGTNGNYLDRYKYNAQGDKLNEVVSPLTITQEEIANIEAKYNTAIEVHYGAFCSWDRIKAMIPNDIRESIDLVIICGGTNDFEAVEEVDVEGDINADEPLWISDGTLGATIDPTWVADTTFYKNGDYNIGTFQGAIASTVMKMQTWCPNAIVVIATPFPRFVTSMIAERAIEPNTKKYQQYKNSNNVTFREMCKVIIDIAGDIGINIIDANGKCGINGVNFENLQYDSVHPNLDGRKLYGQVFCGELNRITRKIN